MPKPSNILVQLTQSVFQTSLVTYSAGTVTYSSSTIKYGGADIWQGGKPHNIKVGLP